jgi:Peptidase A4 family
MYSRKGRRNSRWVWLISAGACVPVLVIAYAVTTSQSGRAADAASVSVPGGVESGAGGWGRGGYTMMPGPAGAASPAAGSAVNDATNAVAMNSENWAGYVSAGTPGQFTSVSASWTQPTLTCGAMNTFSSFWAGLDGDGTDTVEQTGTEADCNAGAATYQGWFEMFPDGPVFYDNPVQPGDAMSASVVANGGGAFTLTLTDSTEGWTQTTNQTSDSAQLGSAEVITEAPSSGTVLPLSNFGTVSFANATVDNAPIGNENPSALTLVSVGGVTEATPAALTGGNAFTVTWDNSGSTAPTPTPTPTATTTTAPPAPTPIATATATGGFPGGHHHHPFGG